MPGGRSLTNFRMIDETREKPRTTRSSPKGKPLFATEISVFLWETRGNHLGYGSRKYLPAAWKTYEHRVAGFFHVELPETIGEPIVGILRYFLVSREIFDNTAEYFTRIVICGIPSFEILR